MAEIKLFNEWLETHDISTSAITLWYALMYIAWRSGWQPEFSIPITVIVSRTKMSRATVYRERESLRRYGLIDFDLGDGRQSSNYRIFGFEERFVSHMETQGEIQTRQPTHVVSQTETQAETQTDFVSHTEIQKSMSDERIRVVSHTETQHETQTEEPHKVVSHTETQSETQSAFVSHTETQVETQNGKPPKVVSHSETQNTARVLPEADLAVGKNEKSPIYINKYKDIDKGGCGGKKKNDDEVKSKSPKKKKPEFDLSFIGDEAWEALVSSWLEYKRSRNESYKSDMSVKKFHTMLRNLSRGDPAAARRIIDKSIANNWAGIFELTDAAAKSRGHPATGQRIGQIKQPEDEERRRKLLEKFGGSNDAGKNKT